MRAQAILVTLSCFFSIAAAPTWTAYDEADSRLSGDYRGLMAQLPPNDRLKLRDEERAWISLRNRTCGFEAKNSCATHFVTRRAEHIEAEIERSSAYRSLPDRDLLTFERTINDVCRGTSGMDADGAVCRKRDAVVSELERRGWCWGPHQAIEADKHWMRQGPRCLPY